jgi:hypothetical protein
MFCSRSCLGCDREHRIAAKRAVKGFVAAGLARFGKLDRCLAHRAARASVEPATSQTLERQFEAWAAEQDAQGLTTEQLNKDSPKSIPDRAFEGTTGSTAPVQKDRVSRSIQRVRTRVSPQDSPKGIRQVQNTRVQAVRPQRNEAEFSQTSAVRN